MVQSSRVSGWKRYSAGFSARHRYESGNSVERYSIAWVRDWTGLLDTPNAFWGEGPRETRPP